MNIAKSTARAVGVIALALGALGCQSPVDADVVIPVPDSGVLWRWLDYYVENWSLTGR